jgi:hypothetical protein
VEWHSTELTGECIFFYGKGNENHKLGAGFLCIRESYQQLRGLSLLVKLVSRIVFPVRYELNLYMLCRRK